MPELPEVETIRRRLEGVVAGRLLAVGWGFPHPKFATAVDAAGARVADVRRKGKFLLLGLEGDRELVIHLGMTGKLALRDAGSEPDRHARARWSLDAPDGPVLELSDIRRFGRALVLPAGRYTGTLATQGPDALDPALTGRDFWAALRSSRRPVKTQLLSQRPIAGVGNIYADEALWLTGIHPGRRRIGESRAAELLHALRQVLLQGIERGGTTLRDYRTFDGATGTNQDHLACYGRGGLPCERCGTTLRRIVLDGRSTTFCAACQH